MPALSQIAIKAALYNDWETAISSNKDILKDNEDDINALCRLAYAFIQIGKINDAKSIYGKILSIDKYNLIAQKNLEKIKSLPKNYKSHIHEKPKSPLSPGLFIEEPGKTKTVSLINTAPCSVISNLDVGDQVILQHKKHSIEVRDNNKTYLGALPDDVSFRLLRLLKGGNNYDVYVKSATKNNVSIFIREVKRGKKFLLQPSFINSSESHSFSLKNGKNTKADDDDMEPSKTQDEDGEV